MSENVDLDDNLVDTTFVPLEVNGYIYQLSRELDRDVIVPDVINKIISCFYDPVCIVLFYQIHLT